MIKLLVTFFSIFMVNSALAGTVNVSDEDAKFLINKFYSTYVLVEYEGNHISLDRVSAPDWGTPKFINKLKKDYDYDCEDNDCYGVYALRTGAQDGEGASGITNITPRSNGWYRVNYRDMGWKGVTDVKVVSINRIPKLDDYKFVSSNVK